MAIFEVLGKKAKKSGFGGPWQAMSGRGSFGVLLGVGGILNNILFAPFSKTQKMTL